MTKEREGVFVIQYKNYNGINLMKRLMEFHHLM